MQPAGACCPSPLTQKVMYQTACHTARITSKYASIFKECLLGGKGCVLRVRAHLFDILTRSCRRQQCVDTGHLAFMLFIIHHPQNKVKEIYLRRGLRLFGVSVHNI